MLKGDKTTCLTMNAAPSETRTQPVQVAPISDAGASTGRASQKALPASVPQNHTVTSHEELAGLNIASSNNREDAEKIKGPFITSAFDVLGDRRKRRKVSEEPEERVLERRKDASVLHGNVEEKPLAPLPEDTAQTRQPDQNSTHNSPHAALPGTPPKRRGRPPKPSSAERNKINQCIAKQTQADSGGVIGEQESTTPEKRATPRKKAMQLSANGKLFEKPSEPQSGSAPQNHGRGRSNTAQTRKNITLKNGKFAPTRIVVIKYLNVSSNSGLLANKVDEILSRPAQPLNLKDKVSNSMKSDTQQLGSAKAPHPFFSSKARQRPGSTLSNTAGTNASGQTTEDEDVATDVKKPVAWKDIAFKSNKPALAKDLQLEKPAWPPRPYQHVCSPAEEGVPKRMVYNEERKRKSKTRRILIGEEENILSCFTRDLPKEFDAQNRILCPKRLYTTPRNALAQVITGSVSGGEFQTLSAARAHALANLSAFDRAEAPGPLPWTQQYGPSSWDQVLQPQCYSLYDWLRGLAVHHVKQGLDPTRPRPAPKRRKKQKKREDELDDFIVDDSDQSLNSTKIKNAILIVGPNGCGKTASVYAVAKQLGFEVFEIHAGMRRSQKDIFDKVGDMAQNHMVQQAQPLSRDSSIVHEMDTPLSQEEPAQQSVATFLADVGKKKALQTSRPATPQPSKEQKQSLILFEEVDHVFEEDRGFWGGVQSLIQNSKRPVVLTCNDLANIPLDELDLHTILTYIPPLAEVASEYLTYIAAAEGHLIQPKAIESLYRSKDCDLRATMAELDFWCQMTVGSEKCGLDWLPDFRFPANSTEESRQRIFSQDTYQEGLDLLPESCHDLEDTIQYIQGCLDLPIHELLGMGLSGFCVSAELTMQQILDTSEYLSVADMLDPSTQPLLYASLFQDKRAAKSFPKRGQLVQAKIAYRTSNSARSSSFECFEPLGAERPVFPPAQGRLAPSLDLPRSVIVTDIAPYVRSIAFFDQRLEQQRDELFPSQGKKARTTRAARAAAEGGDKASTRRERWFSTDLDLEAVLKTGGNWSQWLDGEDTEQDLTPAPL